MELRINDFESEVIQTFVERWISARLQNSEGLHAQNSRMQIQAQVFMDIETKALMSYVVGLYQQQMQIEHGMGQAKRIEGESTTKD